MKPSQFAKFLELCLIKNENVLVVGGPGIGKSTITAQVAAKLGWPIIFGHPVTEDPTKYGGQSWVINDGKGNYFAVKLPYEDLRKLIDATTPIIFFIDDLIQAALAVQGAAMQLVEARQVGAFTISKEVRFVSASNRKEDRAGGGGVVEPLKDRFCIVTLEPDLDDLIVHAAKTKWYSGLIAFMRYFPRLLSEWKPKPGFQKGVTPRGLERVSRMLYWTESNNGNGEAELLLTPDLEQEAFSGSIGEEATAELMTFLRIYRTLPMIDEILTDPTNAPVPTAQDQLYAVCGALNHRSDEKNISNILKYADRFVDAEFAIMMVKDIVRSKPQLNVSKPMVTWLAKHPNLIL